MTSRYIPHLWWHIFAFVLFFGICAVSRAADNLVLAKPDGNINHMYLITADGHEVPAIVAYTSDGMGNIIPIGSGGGGTSNVFVTNFPAIQAVSQSGSWTVTANQGTNPWIVDGSGFTQPVSGTVAVSNFPATQPVSGTVTALQGTSPWVVSGSVTAAVTQGTTPWIVDGSGFTQPVSGSLGRTWTLSSGTDSVSAVVSNFPATQAVTQSTSPWVVSGTVTANAGTGNFTVVQPTGTNLHTVVDSGTLSATQGTSPWVVSGTVTSNQGTSPWVENVSQFGGSNVVTGTGASGAGIPRVTVANDSNVLATQSGTWTVQQGTPPWSNNITQWGGSATTLGQKVMASSVPVVLASDQSAVTITTIPGNPTVATYAAAANFTVAATPTDVFTIIGSGTKTIQVRNVTVSGTNTGNTNFLIQIVKRSTADTGGTSTTTTLVPLDSNNAAATTTVRSYTANPTLGTLVGAINNRYCFLPALASTNVATTCQFDYGTLRDQAVYLRGADEQLAVNLNGATLGGTTILGIRVEWTEE